MLFDRQIVVVRRRDGGKGTEHRIVLGRAASLIATVLTAAAVIAVVTLTILLGYLALGLVLAVTLCAMFVAVLRGVWRSLKASKRG